MAMLYITTNNQTKHNLAAQPFLVASEKYQMRSMVTLLRNSSYSFCPSIISHFPQATISKPLFRLHFLTCHSITFLKSSFLALSLFPHIASDYFLFLLPFTFLSLKHSFLISYTSPSPPFRCLFLPPSPVFCIIKTKHSDRGCWRGSVVKNRNLFTWCGERE